MRINKPRRLLSLNTPRPIEAEAHADGRPALIKLGKRSIAVEEWHETWRIDDEWWRPKPVSRAYWRVSLEDGRVVDVYRDLAGGGWFRQAYG